MGCLFSKKDILIENTNDIEVGLHVQLFESNINYINPIRTTHSSTDGHNTYFL
jgi:hypothetical protein